MAKAKLPEAAPDGGKTISARDAVLAATTYFAEVAGNTSGVSVEEIELTDDAKFWLVTLGVVVPLVKTSAFGPTGPGAYGLGEVA